MYKGSIKPAETIRISCAALCQIEIGGRFLFEINKNRGNVLTPLGGALEFHEQARPFLLSLGVKFQEGHDLRLTLPERRLPKFREWFVKKTDRETDPQRELREELIEEHQVLPFWPTAKASMSWLRLAELEQVSTREGQEGVLTHYFYEIVAVRLPDAVAKACVERAAGHLSRLYLLYEEETRGASAMHQGYPLAETCRIVLQS
ncbi:MAG: hypothetical protein IT581_22155 [Verrucomicrobiales bacterium]|nr:hypothetical protein [Verrucomicrobiales bacterium]